MSQVVYRASELGGCTKALVAGRLGYTPMQPPEKFVGYFKRGDDVESLLRQTLQARGFAVSGDQSEVAVVVSDSIRVVGHIDGIIWDGSILDRDRHGRVWECKRVSAGVFKQFVGKGWGAEYPLLERYRWQVSCYMVATGKELRFDVVDGSSCDGGADDNGELRYHTLYLEKPFYSKLQIQMRVLGIEATVAQGVLPDDCDTTLRYPCPFYYLPGHSDDVEVSTDEVLLALAKETLQAKRDAEVAVSREKELRRQLLGAMGEQSKVRTDVATLSVQTSSRTEWDQELLSADGVVLDKYRKKVEGSRYVRLTPRKATVTTETTETKEVGDNDSTTDES